MKIKIPFKSCFEDALLSGSKTWTSRTRKYGEVGDIFEAFGATFIIERVFRENLGFIASYHYREEGCDSRQEFINVWRKIHWRKGFDPRQEVWVHHFTKVEG